MTDQRQHFAGLRPSALVKYRPSSSVNHAKNNHGSTIIDELDEHEDEGGEEEEEERLRLACDLLAASPPPDSPAHRLLAGLRLPHNRVLRDQGRMTDRAARAVLAALLRLNRLEGEALAFARAVALSSSSASPSLAGGGEGEGGGMRSQFLVVHAPTGVRAVWGMAQHARKWVG